MLGQPSSSSSHPAQSIFNLLMWPLIVYGIMASLTIYSWKGAVWFTWHPVAMIISCVVLAGNATLIKKVGGYENTKTHGIMMMASTLIAAFGFYVIYQQKIMNNSKNIAKDASFVVPHFKSLHAKIGLAVMVGYTALALVGAVALHPDFGILKRNNNVRFLHKWAGRILTALAWSACVLGLQSMGKDQYTQAAFAIPLLIMGFYVLL